MELQFEKTPWPCLTTVAAQVRGEEVTQELRLPDNLPDIGKVLMAWGQVLLRGKEWRGNGMTVSGGIVAWVLYEAEDGSGPQCVESWIPFQLKWDFPETQHDGSMVITCSLSAMDARSVSARKIMLRGAVSALGEALEPDTVEVYTPAAVPEDVYLRKDRYPVRLPREAGEKQFEVEQELTLPGSGGQAEKLLRYSFQPEITDAKVMAGKVVFRGVGRLHLLYQDLEGNLRTWDQDVDFSQFGDLEQDFGEEAQVRVVPALTNLELELAAPDRLNLKAGMVGQYVVSDLQVLEIVEDAYSNRREVTPVTEMLRLPVVLDSRNQTLRLEKSEELNGNRVVDTCFLTAQPRQRRQADGLELEQVGTFQLLYSEASGNLQGKTIPIEEKLDIPADGNSTVSAASVPSGKASAAFSGGEISVRGEVLLHTMTTMDQGIPMVTGLTLGELRQPDPNRPSMILRRAGEKPLWNLAKESGSTVEAICQINQLQGEPEESRLLLIPVS